MLLATLAVLCGAFSVFYGHRKSEELSEWQLSERLHEQSLHIELDIARTRLHNAQLEREIAIMEGKSTKKADADIQIANNLIDADQQVISMHDMEAGLGSSENVASAERDVSLAYLILWISGLLLVGSAFFFALGVLRPRSAARSQST